MWVSKQIESNLRGRKDEVYDLNVVLLYSGWRIHLNTLKVCYIEISQPFVAHPPGNRRGAKGTNRTRHRQAWPYHCWGKWMNNSWSFEAILSKMKPIPRCWQLKYFQCSSLPGDMIQFEEHIFSDGLKPPTSIPSKFQDSPWKCMLGRCFFPFRMVTFQGMWFNSSGFPKPSLNDDLFCGRGDPGPTGRDPSPGLFGSVLGVVYVKHVCVWTLKTMKNSQHEICSNVPGSPLHAKNISKLQGTSRTIESFWGTWESFRGWSMRFKCVTQSLSDYWLQALMYYSQLFYVQHI